MRRHNVTKVEKLERSILWIWCYIEYNQCSFAKIGIDYLSFVIFILGSSVVGTKQKSLLDILMTKLSITSYATLIWRQQSFFSTGNVSICHTRNNLCNQDEGNSMKINLNMLKFKPKAFEPTMCSMFHLDLDIADTWNQLTRHNKDSWILIMWNTAFQLTV